MLFGILVLAFVTSVLGWDESSIRFSLDYFKYRELPFTCLVTCRNNNWSHKYAKEATNELIATAEVKANSIKDFNNVAKCFSQKLGSAGVVIFSQCLRFDEILRFASENNFLDSMHKWLIISNEYQTMNETNAVPDIDNDTELNKTLIEVMATIKISVDSDIVVGVENGNWSYNLYEIYNIGTEQGGNLNIEHIGYWNNQTGFNLKINLNDYKYYRRWNFEQWRMRMIAVVSDPPDDFTPDLITGRTLAPGVAVITQTAATVLEVVAEMHNFSYNYTFAERWIGDFTTKNSKVVGDSLYIRSQDISPVIRFIPSIHEKIDVIHPPLTSIETRYYYRIPTYGAGKFENQFLRPLTSGAWVCVFAVVSLCAIVLMLSAVLEHRPMPGQYAVFSVVASFSQQFFEDSGNQDLRRKSVARKITILVTGLSCLLIYNYYTSSVVSWLLNGPPPSINSLEELLESPLNLIYEDIGYTRSWLQTPSYYYNKRNAKIEDEIRKKKVFSKKKDEPLLLSVDDGIEMVKAGGYAYHTEINTANLLISRKFTQTELCELGSLPSMEKTVLYTAVQKNSPYKEFFIWSLARLAERGIVSCIQHRTSSVTVKCEGSSPRALALGGAAPAFILLAFGFLLATVIVIFERFLNKRLKTRTIAMDNTTY